MKIQLIKQIVNCTKLKNLHIHKTTSRQVALLIKQGFKKAAYGNRTHDLLFTKQLLCQLS